ncbi:MAG: hypothetical protein N2035_02700 [Chthoniobacterales bacterium]|nr:hypothetical protein [Chthoniobacterales bacterium]
MAHQLPPEAYIPYPNLQANFTLAPPPLQFPRFYSTLRPIIEKTPNLKFNLPVGPTLEEYQMRQTILDLRNTIRELSQSLANANAEAEALRRHNRDLLTQLESLGIAKLDTSSKSLENKLLNYARDLRDEQERSIQLESALLALSESVIALLQEATNVPPDLRLDLEAQLRQIQELLGAPAIGIEEALPVEASLTNALVLEVKPELSLLIVNIGSRHGVRIATPFRILRGSEFIGTALTVDVRERICGAIVQSLSRETNLPRPGDRIMVITQ